jgi:hypothetical protein
LRNGASVVLTFNGASWVSNSLTLSSSGLRAEAANGTTLVTLTAQLRSGIAVFAPQPLLSTLGTPNTASPIGDPPLPLLPAFGNPPAFSAFGQFVSTTAGLFVDGLPTSGSIVCGAGSTGGVCNPGPLSIDLANGPGVGLHLLQVQNPAGLFSNDFPICGGTDIDCRDSQ